MATPLSLKAILDAEKTKYETTLYGLIMSVNTIQVGADYSLISTQETVEKITESSKSLSELITSLIGNVANALAFTDEITGATARLDSNPDVSCYFWIVHSMATVASDLVIFGKICEDVLTTGKWPSDIESLPKFTFLSCIVQTPLTKSSDTLRWCPPYVETAQNFIDLETTNLRLFSDAMISAYESGEINSNVSGVFKFINLWVGMIDGIMFVKEDAAFKSSSKGIKQILEYKLAHASNN